jgi:hypothetical protein
VVPVPYIPNFVHRENADSTFDSFCRSCFVTVAKSRLEADLRGKERDHICDPWDLKLLQNAATLGFFAAVHMHLESQEVAQNSRPWRHT